jgi:3-methyladenine DNA glycosylase AlkD
LDDVLAQLRALRSQRNIDGMARFAIRSERDEVLGISLPDLRRIARQIGRDHAFAGGLWACGLHEAKQLACMVEEPGRLTSAQLDRWVKDIDSWDVCDGFAYSLVSQSQLAWKKPHQWAKRRDEFVRRAAFATIAGLAVHDKKASDADFMPFLALCRQYADDDRNFVKKAVNWALRQIGKRNVALNAAAIRRAEQIRDDGSRAGRWIAAGALRELRSDAVQQRLGARARAST